MKPRPARLSDVAVARVSSGSPRAAETPAPQQPTAVRHEPWSRGAVTVEVKFRQYTPQARCRRS